jgi:hypothetical protein
MHRRSLFLSYLQGMVGKDQKRRSIAALQGSNYRRTFSPSQLGEQFGQLL